MKSYFIKYKFYYILFILICIANYHNTNVNADIHHQEQTAQNLDDQKNSIRNEKLIVRLPSNTLLKYTSYKDVSILHFRIPSDTRTAFFTFKAFEESKSAFQRRCQPRDVSLHLKASSYPVISPENISFPRNFLNEGERFKIYDLNFKSDEAQHRITIEGPQIGNWFAIAFVSWTDPNADRIEQQGLAASCETSLSAEMSVSSFQPIILNNGYLHNGTLISSIGEIKNNSLLPTTPMPIMQNMNDSANYLSTEIPITLTTVKNIKFSRNSVNKEQNSQNSSTHGEDIFKFFVPPNIGTATVRVLILKTCYQCPNIGFYVEANAFPCVGLPKEDYDESHHVYGTIIKTNQTGEITFDFHVQPQAWHYAVLKFVPNINEFTQDSNLKLMRTKSRIDRKFRTQYQPEDNLRWKRTKRSNETIWYQLEYSLQVNFHLPIVANISENQTKPLVAETDLKSQTNLTKNSDIKNETNMDNPSGPILNSWQPELFRGIEFYPLLRQTYREFFMFDYDLLPDINETVPTVVNLTAGTPAGFQFEVGEVFDIGGTLTFAVSMKFGSKSSSDLKISSSIAMSVTERNGILAEKLISRPSGSGFAADSENNENGKARSNQTIIVCMHLGEPGEPTWPDKCRYGRKFLPASSIVNNTDSNTSTGLIHVPFPESGQWYVTMGLYCHGAETAARVTVIDSVKEFVKQYAHVLNESRPPCACVSEANRLQTCLSQQKCLSAMNETETLKIKECLMDSKCTSDYIEMTQKFEIHHKLATEQHFALENCNSSVVFSISSSPCVAGRCGRFGRCYHYMSGGFVFSTCVCMKGYRGWDCTDDTDVPSNMSILLACLFLTLSNLLFFPSIYMAIKRKYYTEAIIYFFAMFFSIFYHACDSGEDEYGFCLVKIGVLQFCDFYCGLLAIWVTLVAMAHIRQQFVSLLHMFGAILLAFGTELNKQSLWVFLAPALTGICIISVSWGMRCHKSRKWFPSRKYLVIFMPFGMILVMIGLVCYAFLQTKQNYHIVHSIWHMVMALSILCLLPSRTSFLPKC